MSSFSSLHSKGFISAIAGAGCVIYGAAAGSHLVLLAGLALVVLAVVRFRATSRRQGR